MSEVKKLTKFERFVQYIEGQREAAKRMCKNIDTSTPQGKARLKELQQRWKLYDDLVQTAGMCWDDFEADPATTVDQT